MPAARALLVVPPLLKYSAGPLLGPALLVAAARAAGHEADALDLSIRWIRERLPPDLELPASTVVGDHDKPGALLSALQRETFVPMLQVYLTDFDRLGDADPHLSLTCSHDAVDAAVERLVASPVGHWIRSQLESSTRPDVFGVSVLFSGQVLLGLVASAIARELWPSVQIVWGGAHVTALQDRIVQDARFGRFVDTFVIGYAERTFVELLDAVARDLPLPQECLRAGGRMVRRAVDDPTHAPVFQDLSLYGLPRLTLPTQASRGCSYGKCEFCTYPTIEGVYRTLQDAVVEPVVRTAAERGANVAFKDSLLVPKRLAALSEQIAGRVRWSGCTKLHASLDATALRRLSLGGCDTLEVGLETIDPEQQRRIDKKQSKGLFLRVLDAAGEAGVGLVVNYITGFPEQNAVAAAEELAWVREELSRRTGLRAVVEHNDFQLERLSPMARSPDAWGIAITGEWPWASVLGWRMATAPRALPGLRVVA
ncbi:B12-binding domain-containing radical SAM protein [Polyangium spumosum]|uniref:Radical SAM protein n=1 Tax=Polyangium spumosum TaxID=889282 RepID=A0A6N7Q1R1_9BACT|nr:radical SAM protein [Polyangium spumosum]MRG98402.1 radical SAM protein [Polyangium spumosum]